MIVTIGFAIILVAMLFGSLVMGVVMIIGSRKMMRLESYRWAMTASILALLPCSPAALLGLVMGVWSLIVLNRVNVIAAFEAQQNLPAGQPSPAATGKSKGWLVVCVIAGVAILGACAASPIVAYILSWGSLDTASQAQPEFSLSASTETHAGAQAEMTSQTPLAWRESASLRRPTRPLSGGLVPPTQVAFSSDGKTLIALIDDFLYSWEKSQETPLGRRPLGELLRGARSRTLSPTGDAITLVRDDGTVDLVDIGNGTRQAQVNPGPAIHALFAPNRSLVSVAGEAAALKLWDVSSDSERATLATRTPVTAQAFSPDGALLAGGCTDGTVWIWEIESGEALMTLEGLASAVACLAFSHDGQRLAAVTHDGIVQIWFVETGNRESAFNSAQQLSSAVFDPQEGSLLTGSLDGTVKRWEQNSADTGEKERAPVRIRLVRVGLLRGEPDKHFFGLAVQGAFAYLAGPSLTVVDISTPSRPRVVGACPLPEGAEALAVSGHYAYLLAGPQHLRVVDLSDSVAPRLVGSCLLGEHLRGIAAGQDHEPEVDGQPGDADRHVYVTDGESLRVIDVSDPAAPTILGRYAGDDLDALGGIAVVDHYAFVGADTGGLRVIDISDPREPREVSTFEGPGNATRVTIAGKYAYVSGGEDSVSLWIADVSDPPGPKALGRYGNWVADGGVAVQNGNAYLLGGELDIVDVSDPVAPKPVGMFAGSGDPGGVVGWQVAAAGNYVYVVGEAGLSILRVVRTPE